MIGWMKRLAPVGILVALGATAAGLGLHEYLSMEAVREHQLILRTFVEENPILSASVYLGLYAAVVALSLPGAMIMSAIGGFMFGWGVGVVLAVSAATMGGTLIFLAARTAVGDSLRSRAGPYLRRIEQGFQSDAFNYLLFLRLMPIFPFWAVNLSMGLLGIPLTTYVVGTAIGIIPGSIVTVAVGSGLGDFVGSEDANLSDILNPTILFGLAGLASMSLLPVAFRKWRNWRAERKNSDFLL